MAIDRKAMLEKLRAKMKARQSGRSKDPNEWRAPRVSTGETFKLKVKVLPPVNKGETCATGTAQVGMDDLFYYPVGFHWINSKLHPCPRVFDGDRCPYCQLGFDMMKEVEDKDARSEISRTYLPRTQYAVNIYVLPVDSNPEDLRGRVLYYAMPKTIFDKLDECVQREDDGGDPDDPMPFGLFYFPEDAYTLQIEINRKGDYNNYESSKFLPTSRGPIAKTDEEIQKILDQRHDIPTKYQERDTKVLEKEVGLILNGTDTSSGFDQDETKTGSVDSNQKSTDNEEETSSPVKDQEDEELARMLEKMRKAKATT